MEPDKVDLSSVNKTKKQFKLPGLKNLFAKKGAGPSRDEIGRFSSGGGGLKAVKKFNWGRALPLILIIALAGGYFVYRSFAGTYRDCERLTASSYTYSEECVMDSDEASLVRLYFGIINRAPDPGGYSYWLRQLTRTDKYHKDLAEIARQLMGSPEFKRKYGTLNNEQFVKAMYPQVFGRDPDAGGLAYWTNRLNRGTISRHSMMASFVQSSEMKRSFATLVADALNIHPSEIGERIKSYSSEEVSCYGTVTTDSAGKKWCEVSTANASSESRSIVFASVSTKDVVSTDGRYALWVSYKYQNADSSPAPGSNTSSGIQAFPMGGSPESGQLTYESDGMRGYGPDNGTGSQAWYIGQSYLRPSLGDDKYFAVLSTRGVQPSNAKYSIDMSSLQLVRWGTKNGLDIGSSIRSYSDKSALTKKPSNDMSPLYYGAQKIPVDTFRYSIDATSTSQKPDILYTPPTILSGVNSTVLGGNRINVGGPAENIKLKIRLRDPKTAQPINFTVYRDRGYESSPRVEKVSSVNGEATLSSNVPSGEWGYDYTKTIRQFSVEYNLDKPIKPELSVSYEGSGTGYAFDSLWTRSGSNYEQWWK